MSSAHEATLRVLQREVPVHSLVSVAAIDRGILALPERGGDVLIYNTNEVLFTQPLSLGFLARRGDARHGSSTGARANHAEYCVHE